MADIKVDLTKLTVRQRISYRILLAVEPLYLRLRDSLQNELRRIANIEAIAKGTKLWLDFQTRKQHVYPPVPSITVEEQRQRSCSHAKGGRGPRSVYKDYNIMHHLYPDFSEVIKCLSCGKKWWKDKPIIGPGGREERFTDIDWNIAFKMTESTTNTVTASERAIQTIRVEKPDGPDTVPQQLPGRVLRSDDSKEEIPESTTDTAKPRRDKRSKKGRRTSSR